MGFNLDMPEDQGGKTIMFAPWPKPLDEDIRGHYGLDHCYLEMVDAKYALVTQGRNLRREVNIPPSKKVTFILKPPNAIAQHDADVLKLLLNAEKLVIDPNYEPQKGTPTVHSTLGDLHLPMEGLVNVEAEKARIKKELEKAEAEIAKVEQKLANPQFEQNGSFSVGASGILESIIPHGIWKQLRCALELLIATDYALSPLEDH